MRRNPSTLASDHKAARAEPASDDLNPPATTLLQVIGVVHQRQFVPGRSLRLDEIGAATIPDRESSPLSGVLRHPEHVVTDVDGGLASE